MSLVETGSYHKDGPLKGVGFCLGSGVPRWLPPVIEFLGGEIRPDGLKLLIENDPQRRGLRFEDKSLCEIEGHDDPNPFVNEKFARDAEMVLSLNADKLRRIYSSG